MLPASACRWWLGIAALVAAQLAVGCVRAPKAQIPFLSYRAEESTRQRNLLILLRGLGADNTVFAKKGIIEEIRKRRLPFDVIAPDVHYGYYKSRTFEKRFKADIIDPARAQGYQQIWLAGFSMGGLGSLLYVRSYPNDVDAVLLTSPFLGWRFIHREIRRAGGVAAWQQTSDDPRDWQRMLWSWIKNHDPAATPPIWLGHGDGDILAAGGPPLLASVLPAERVFSVPGNHTISTFKAIFLRHLDTLARQSAPGGNPKATATIPRGLE
jgi:pimeloyl-ACP methyl ester carboxylesterase